MRNKKIQFNKNGQVQPRLQGGQAIMEIAIFGAIVIFLMGVLLRTHLNTTQNQDHQVKAMKLALQQSNKNSLGIGKAANSSRDSASVLFIEDRLSPDFNKFNTIDRGPFIAQGSGTMSNRLEYPVDFVTYGNEPLGEVGYNLPIMDIFINGQHFPLTTAAYVFRILYQISESCPNDTTGLTLEKGPEHFRCWRQQAETDVSGNHTFYGMTVNGTAQYDPAASNATYDLLRNNNSKIPVGGIGRFDDDVPGCPGTRPICNSFAWQWRGILATPDVFSKEVPTTNPDNVILGFGSKDSPSYPVVDTSGSLKEQSLYAVSDIDLSAIKGDAILMPYQINGNPHLLSLTQTLINDGPSLKSLLAPNGYNFANNINLPNPNPLGITTNPTGTITAVVVLDSQLGDLDQSYDAKSSTGPPPGLMREAEIYSEVRPGTYLQIKEGKLYNPETQAVVRSVSSKDHTDLISRSFQLSNNTGRFCMIVSQSTDGPRTEGNGYYRPAQLIDQDGEENPVKACSDGCWGENTNKTCYSPSTRILYVRTLVGERNTRKWFTNVTKGL